MGYPKSAYGTHNPNAGRPANGDVRAWGGHQWPAGVPSSLMASTNYTNRTNGQTMRVSMRRELVELWNLAFQLIDTKHNYPVWANRNGENWGPWGYANRAVSGTNTPSGHSAALSVDMNAPNNGYSSTWQSDMPPAMVADLESLGLYWGGRYTSKYDPMHYGYCYPPSSVAGHVARARSLLGGTPTPLPPDQKEQSEMALILLSSTDPRPHLFMQGSDAIQLGDGNSTEAFRKAGIPVVNIPAADWDRIRSRYEVEPLNVRNV